MLEILLVEHVDDREALLLSKLLNEQWQQNTTAEIIQKRLSSGNPFFIARDKARKRDVKYIKETYGIEYEVREQIPIGILETVLMDTVDYNDLDQKDYKKITQDDGNAAWVSPSSTPKSLLLADITFLPTRWGRKITQKDESKHKKTLSYWTDEYSSDKTTAADAMIEYAITYAKKLGLHHLWTLTPWKEKTCEFGVNVHVSHGARPTEKIIDVCRPDYFIMIRNKKEGKEKEFLKIYVPAAKITSYYRRLI